MFALLANIRKYLDLKSEISKLRQDVDKLQDEWKRVADEWEDWFDRFKRLHARIARRQQRDEQAAISSTEEPQGAESEATPEGQSPLFSSLSPRARAVQNEILRRRARQNGGE